MKRLLCAFASVVTLGLAQSTPVYATTIEFLANDLGDVVLGEDLWEYRYFVSAFAFPPDHGFSVYFDPGLYKDLEDPALPVNPDWDVITFQPQPGVPLDGIYDALAVANPGPASLADPFVLTFVWLGGAGTSPGGQPFDLNQFDAQGALIAVLEQGRTVTAAVAPEPSTLALVGVGLLALHRRRRKR